MRRALLIFVFWLTWTAAEAKNYVVVLSANTTAQDEVSAFIGNVYQHLQPKDKLVVFDATHLKTVATLQMPDKIEDGRRGRIKALGPAAGQIADFVASKDSSVSENNLNIPAALREIGMTVLPTLGEANVMFIGSLFFDNQSEAKFTNREYVFSDGFLNRKGFMGVVGQETVLKGALVSICYMDPLSAFLSEGFRKATVSFWGKSIAGRGGKVGAIQEYGPACVARLESDAVDGTKYEIDWKEKEYLTKMHWVGVEVR